MFFLCCSYLELDVVHITVKNTFQWLNGSRHDSNAVHEEILTVLVSSFYCPPLRHLLFQHH